MTVEEAFEHVKNSRLDVFFVNGKTATGKTTFAKRLQKELGFALIEMDTVARDGVIIPLKLPDNGSVHKEIYKYRNHMDWISQFINKLQAVAVADLAHGHAVVIDGAMPNITTMKELFAGLPHPEIIFFHPANVKKYEQYITQRFMKTNENNNASLPPSFWGMMDDAQFKIFCETRELTPKLKDIIAEYAAYGQRSSNDRLDELRKNFDNIVVVYI